MTESERKEKQYAALPNWMNPNKLRRIEEEFYGIHKKKDAKSREELLDMIYVREEPAKEKGEA